MSTSESSSSLPPYLRASPSGMHITNLLEFFRSPYRAPFSTSQNAQEWGSEQGTAMVNQIFPHDEDGIQSANIFVYNRTRDTDRICPQCKRWYRVGDPITSYPSLEAFLNRPVSSPDLEHDEVAYEQDLSGICSRECMLRMNGGVETDVFGKDIDHVTDRDWEVLQELSAQEGGVIGLKLTPEEQKEMGGVKMVFIPK